jgi:hypothetical protein
VPAAIRRSMKLNQAADVTGDKPKGERTACYISWMRHPRLALPMYRRDDEHKLAITKDGAQVNNVHVAKLEHEHRQGG